MFIRIALLCSSLLLGIALAAEIVEYDIPPVTTVHTNPYSALLADPVSFNLPVLKSQDLLLSALSTASVLSEIVGL